MMFDRVDQQSATKQAGGAGGSTTYQAFLAADKAWSAVRNMPVGCVIIVTPCIRPWGLHEQQQSAPADGEPFYWQV
jgi:hypothetical protein